MEDNDAFRLFSPELADKLVGYSTLFIGGFFAAEMIGFVWRVC